MLSSSELTEDMGGGGAQNAAGRSKAQNAAGRSKRRRPLKTRGPKLLEYWQ